MTFPIIFYCYLRILLCTQYYNYKLFLSYVIDNIEIIKIFNSFFAGPGIVMGPPAGPEPAQISAISEGLAELPCDVNPRHSNDSVLLVVWYKDDTPIYRYRTILTHSI